MKEQTAIKLPQIRFKGFEEEWETKRVDAFAPLQRGFDLPTTKTKPGRYPVVYSNGILRSHNEYKCEAPGVVTGRSGTIGKVTFVSVNYWPHNTSLWVTNFFKNDPGFIHYFYVNFRLERFNAGSTIPTLNRNDVHAINASIPTPAEQIQVGEYFRELDRLIGLHQRKHDKLVTLKKAMLQKMFPLPGVTTPEIRFRGFEGVWEETKLGEVCGPFEYGLNASAKTYDGRNKYIRITDIDEASRNFSQTSLTTPDADLVRSTNYLLTDGDMLFARTGASVGKTYRYRQSDGRVFFAGFLIRAKVFNPSCVDFIFYTTLTSHYGKFVAINSQRSGQPGINASEYSEFTFRAPSAPEQQKIGTYFRTLDELISKHAIQLQKLQQIKSACLEKMFV